LSRDQFSFSLARVRDYFVYILSNNSQVLYIGVTSNLDSRLFQHVRERALSSFAARYNLDRLVYYETYPTPAKPLTAKNN
jgi:putative endonuclease